MLTAVFKDLERHCSDCKSSKNLVHEGVLHVQDSWEVLFIGEVVFYLAP